ncbi:MAG TPA: hypothetical protein VFX59_10225 [Polyangiales bacterium]|nr:hypothetical protein [Polyangiales bacterium]
MKRLFSLMLLLTACHSKTPHEAPAICERALPELLAHKSPNALPAQAWFELMFKGYQDGIPEDAVDCAGEPIEWPDMSHCAEGEPSSLLVERHTKLGSEQLVVRHAGGDYWFGWAPFKRFADGMQEGPVVIARNHEGKLEVRAAGTLRAFPAHAKLEVREVAKEHLLIAEGELCVDKQCERATRVMWLDRQRFRARPLRSVSQRQCLAPAWFPHHEQIEVKLGDRWRRVLERELSLAFDEHGLLIDEHIRVRDHDLTQPSLPPRAFRDAAAQLRISPVQGELLSEGHSLWRSIQVEDASTQVAQR